VQPDQHFCMIENVHERILNIFAWHSRHIIKLQKAASLLGRTFPLAILRDLPTLQHVCVCTVKRISKEETLILKFKICFWRETSSGWSREKACLAQQTGEQGIG
jgi:hypothetical protein